MTDDGPYSLIDRNLRRDDDQHNGENLCVHACVCVYACVECMYTVEMYKFNRGNT